jgi:N-acetylneuraminic acid mutarotase
MKTSAGIFIKLIRVFAMLMLTLSVIQPAKASFFTPTGPLNTARFSHAAALLQNGKVLVAGGFNGNIGEVGSSESYDPASGTWTTNGDLLHPCSDHTMTLLTNGKVLKTGGDDFNGSLTNAELFDPASGTWTETGHMTNARALHTATLLTNGMVLVAGGYDFNLGYVSKCELYNPTTGTWTNTGTLNNARIQHTATLLPNGRVLVVGGDGGGICELYNPVSGNWTLTGTLHAARQNQTATLLSDGRVLVAGGSGDNSAEIYDPNTGLWTLTSGAMNAIRGNATATLLAGGQVLVAGGFEDDGTTPAPSYMSTELYDPPSDTWLTNVDMTAPRGQHTATLLSNGNVLMAGGYDGTNGLSSAELYFTPPPLPSPGRWTLTSSLTNATTEQTATLLPNGKVLVAGGMDTNNNPVSRALLYDPATGTWSGTLPLNKARFNHTATLLANGLVLVVGGDTNIFDASSAIGSAELYNPTNGTWTLTGSLHTPRYTHTATLLPNGQVLVAGGQSTNVYPNITASAEIYNPATGLWTAINPMLIQRNSHTATLLPNGQVLVAGGEVTNSLLVTGESELFNPTNATWTQTGFMTDPFAFHTATLLPNGQVLVAGGDIDEGFGFGIDLIPSSEAQLYDPVAGTWTATTSMNFVHDHHTATLLTNGVVLIAGGGTSFSATTNCELYEPFSQTWTKAASLINARQNHTATLLPNGQVLATGGQSFGIPLASAELYNSIMSPPIVLVNPIKLSSGAFQFSWTNTAGSSNVVLATTNLITPPANWISLTAIVETSPGHFQFTDPQATNTPRRFYRVRSP